MSEDGEDRFAALAKKDRELRESTRKGGRSDRSPDGHESDDSCDSGDSSDATGSDDGSGAERGSGEAADAEKEVRKSTDTGDGSGEPADAADGPAFDFDGELRRSVYVRPASWAAFEDAIDFDVERELREYGIRDLTGREAHDAMVRLAAEHPERLTELVLEARGIDPDDP